MVGLVTVWPVSSSRRSVEIHRGVQKLFPGTCFCFGIFAHLRLILTSGTSLVYLGFRRDICSTHSFDDGGFGYFVRHVHGLLRLRLFLLMRWELGGKGNVGRVSWLEVLNVALCLR